MDIADPEGLTPYTVNGKTNFPVQVRLPAWALSSFAS